MSIAKITHYYTLYYKKKSLLVIVNNSTNTNKNKQLPLTLDHCAMQKCGGVKQRFQFSHLLIIRPSKAM